MQPVHKIPLLFDVVIICLRQSSLKNKCTEKQWSLQVRSQNVSAEQLETLRRDPVVTDHITSLFLPFLKQLSIRQTALTVQSERKQSFWPGPRRQLFAAEEKKAGVKETLTEKLHRASWSVWHCPHCVSPPTSAQSSSHRLAKYRCGERKKRAGVRLRKMPLFSHGAASDAVSWKLSLVRDEYTPSANMPKVWQVSLTRHSCFCFGFFNILVE